MDKYQFLNWVKILMKNLMTSQRFPGNSIFKTSICGKIFSKYEGALFLPLLISQAPQVRS